MVKSSINTAMCFPLGTGGHEQTVSKEGKKERQKNPANSVFVLIQCFQFILSKVKYLKWTLNTPAVKLVFCYFGLLCYLRFKKKLLLSQTLKPYSYEYLILINILFRKCYIQLKTCAGWFLSLVDSYHFPKSELLNSVHSLNTSHIIQMCSCGLAIPDSFLFNF